MQGTSSEGTLSQEDLGAAAAQQPGAANPEYWQELLSSPEPDAFGARARSASDAAVLRRKGHLKEQDKMIEFLLRMHETHTSAEVMQKMERWIVEHRQDPRQSRLRRMVPTVGSFYTPLRLVDAFREYDEFFALSRRKYVPPNFAEIRHVLNIAQVHSSAEGLKLITFDADGTLYADGAHMEHDNEMIRHIINLLRSNVHVAILTAAGYPGEAERFEQRVEGLLAAFERLRLSKEITDRFHIMGGECNYLLRVSGPNKRLQFVPDGEWKSGCMMSWGEADIQAVLSEAEAVLLETALRLRLPVKVLRKPRAVGVVPTQPTIYEVLEELAITVQNQLAGAPLPFCAFNGGNDVFVDIGNKSLGLEALMDYLKLSPSEVLHVGDRFTASGNDSATRDCCSILWVANPEETDFFIKLLLQDIRHLKAQPYIE
ncbi:hypothetical protein WJX72_010564 [[Myrmecia] bisecta]|uniref:IMP-specific 5'-nucleotidase 1 n=1 Tax=[Myrmecia] bisecta TaxID=41462 RepID=A0AAW1PC36_9CHLO